MSDDDTMRMLKSLSRLMRKTLMLIAHPKSMRQAQCYNKVHWAALERRGLIRRKCLYGTIWLEVTEAAEPILRILQVEKALEGGNHIGGSIVKTQAGRSCLDRPPGQVHPDH